MIINTSNPPCTSGNNSIYCKYIPHIFSEVQNPTNKKHFVIWITTGCYIDEPNRYLYARVRNFDDIGEAREYFKKVFDNLNRPTENYVVLLISKEGLSILEKYGGFNEDSYKIISKFLKGEGVANLC